MGFGARLDHKVTCGSLIRDLMMKQASDTTGVRLREQISTPLNEPSTSRESKSQPRRSVCQ